MSRRRRRPQEHDADEADDQKDYDDHDDERDGLTTHHRTLAPAVDRVSPLAEGCDRIVAAGDRDRTDGCGAGQSPLHQEDRGLRVETPVMLTGPRLEVEPAASPKLLILVLA